MAYVTPDVGGNWIFDNYSQTVGVVDKTTPYLIKTSVVDLAGNILKSTSQSFVVDLEQPRLVYTPGLGATGTSDELTFQNPSFDATEKGIFSFGGVIVDSQSVTLSKPKFLKNEISLEFTDWAGNAAKKLSNNEVWNFEKFLVPLNQGASADILINQIGSVGKYELASNLGTLDVSLLYDTRPTAGEKAAINHISTVGHGPDAITISMDDVLALGVKNSFTTSDKLQMRIDGDAEDKVFLDNKMGTSSSLHWVIQPQLPGDQYIAYTNADLGLELFIQKGIQIQATGVL
jgi:hypothetical protein